MYEVVFEVLIGCLDCGRGQEEPPSEMSSLP